MQSSLLTAFSYQGLQDLYSELAQYLNRVNQRADIDEQKDTIRDLLKKDLLFCFPGFAQVAGVTTILAGVVYAQSKKDSPWGAVSSGLVIRGLFQGLNLGPGVLLVDCLNSVLLERKKRIQTAPEMTMPLSIL